MNSIIFTIISVLIWLASVLQGTGYGDDVVGITRIAIFAIFSLVFVFSAQKELSKKNMLIGAIVVVSFVIVPYSLKQGTSGIEYLTTFLLVFILAKIKMKDSFIKITALAYGAMGILLLLAYNITPIFSKWNPNTIAMMAFFSYMVLYLGFMNVEKRLGKYFIIFTIIVYMSLISITSARSSIIFIAISAMNVFKILNLKNLYKRNIYMILLLFPLIIAIAITNIATTPYFKDLNRWSMENLDKQIFSGRDIIWDYGFSVLGRHFWFGGGVINNGMHNSVVTVLHAFGSIGFIGWIFAFNSIIAKANNYLEDTYVREALTAFFLMYLQQAFELGLVASRPNYIPYLVLGIMLGRIKLLQSKEKEEEARIKIAPKRRFAFKLRRSRDEF